MNKARRAEIERIRKAIVEFQVAMETLPDLEDMKNDIEGVKGDEEEYLENMAENLKGGERGQTAEAAIDALGEAATAIEEVVSAIEEVGSKVDEALEKLDEASS